MATFEYQARTRAGEKQSGIIETSSREAAIDLLQRKNLVIISVKEKAKASILEWKVGGGIKPKQIVVFSRQIATLFEAQIPIAQALATLVGETEHATLRGVLAEVADDVAGGLTLSQSFAKHPDAFSPFYVNLVRSGEESGKLQEVFSHLADYLERSYYLTVKARNALIYPAFVTAAFIAVVVLMLVVVYPRLIEIFQDTGQDLPIYTEIIISMSLFLQEWGLGLLIAVIIGGVLAWRWGKTPAGRAVLDTFLLKMPLIGGLFKKIYVTRMAENLKTLIVGGIPILRALSITRDVVGNAVYALAIEDAIESVKSGSTISAALEQHKDVPVFVTQMVKIGEASGRLDFILGSIGRFYQKEVDSLIENLVTLIEPILILVLGLGVAGLIASVLIPLYNLVNAF